MDTTAEGMRRSSPDSEAKFRLSLAEGFRGEARQDLSRARGRSCVDNSRPLRRCEGRARIAGACRPAHNPAVLPRKALEEGTRSQAERLTECARLLGPDIHAQSDCGDEATWKTPWEISSESDAKEALALADDAVPGEGGCRRRRCSVTPLRGSSGGDGEGAYASAPVAVCNAAGGLG